jgi:5-methyltetrahydrofolate--homocysteine methyltransferase
MAVAVGLDAAILNPLDANMMSLVKTADMLMGKDPACRVFIRAHREGMLTG